MGDAMTSPEGVADLSFPDAVEGLRRGDFSRLAPLFEDPPSTEARPCRIIEWYGLGHFEAEPKALAEALACACFLGRTSVAEFLLARGVDPSAGDGTGMNAFHWAADRGNLETVRLLIGYKAPLETRNQYGGTVLGATVWSAIHAPRADHRAIIEALIQAGARLDAVDYPTGHDDLDDLLRSHGAGSDT
jgi:hypothetical protein